MLYNNPYNQKGVGLLEVMVALMLLGIAVLGFVAMQLRANNVSIEADNNMHAVELARDMHERMRINREGITEFNNAYTGLATGGTFENCRLPAGCSPANLAKFDFEQVRQNAERLGMSIAIRQCPTDNTSEQRHCIYVAWGNTTATIGDNPTDCTNDRAKYQPNAQCIFMESFSYAP
ncbi:MAG: type IV pilus modification protein PilV [Moraxella sp.]|nr:type IV pilus modification protein PilV [Moraxella sp.]